MDHINLTESNAPYNTIQPNNAVAVRKHSGLGIASFIISLLAIIGYIAAIGIIATGVNDIVLLSGEMSGEELVQQSGVIVGFLIFVVAGILNMVSLILGIVGLIIKNRKKVFGILGLVISCISILLMIILFFIGSMIS